MSVLSRMTQGIFVGHHDRTGNSFTYYQEWSFARQKLDETDTERSLGATNWDGLCGTPWQMVAPDLKVTKKVTADKEGAGPPLSRIVVERAPEAEPRRFHVLSADIEAHGLEAHQAVQR